MYTLRQLQCDFQVHSPRDIKYQGWGSDLMTLDGLYEWARILLHECQAQGVGAVAITDHHDMVSAFIALEVLKTEGFNDIWVFPGVEVTDKNRLQAILVFDPKIAEINGSYSAAATEPLQNQILTALGQTITTTQNPDTKLRAPSWADLESLKDKDSGDRRSTFQIPRTERINKTLQEIAKSMEEHFSDRFVLLPNLEKNKHGIFGNDSGREVYLNAGDWFVGGVVGGENETNEDGIKGRLKLDYGERIIACLRTSDQRGDKNKLISPYFGQAGRTSWVKLSEPSTISLTQALISGVDCRIFDKEPEAAEEYICNLTITGADIFDNGFFQCEFMRSLNTFIGGRGTGKSLVLSALMRMFGIDKDWIKKDRDGSKNLSDWEKRHLSLFRDGGPFDDPNITITVEYVKEHSVRYKLTLSSPRLDGTHYWTLDNYSNGEWNSIGDENKDCPDSIGISPMFFLQGQMSSLTVDYQDELTRLIEGPMREERATLRTKIESLASIVTEGYHNSKRKGKLALEAATLRVQLKQKRAEQQSFQNIAKAGLSKKEQELFEAAEPLNRGQCAAEEVESSMESLIKKLDDDTNELANELEEEFAAIKTLRAIDTKKFSKDEGFSGDPYLNSLEEAYKNLRNAIIRTKETGQSALDALEKSRKTFIKKVAGLTEQAKKVSAKELHRKEATTKADALGDEISSLQTRRKAVLKEIDTIDKAGIITRGEDAHKEYRGLVSSYSMKLKFRAEEISKNQELSLLVKITPGGQFRPFLEKLKELVSGANVFGKTWECMDECLSKHDKPAEVLSWLIHSAIEALKAGSQIKIPSIWEDCGFTQKVFNNIIEKTTIEDWSGLSVVLAEDHVDIKYRRKGQKPIPILKASPGERAVELLKLALETTTGPIIIDQPEDDLDNDFLAHHLVDLVQRAKCKNQLIFASHSANLVVHGDSDVICVMETQEDTTGIKRCKQVDVGTIDQPGVCRQIEKIMEGGRNAFENRRRKYHETLDPHRL
jgi:type III restriction enzyme